MSLLLDDYPLLILPKLACLIGLNQAIVLQQVHYWIQHYKREGKLRHYHDGRWWVYNAVESSKDVPDWRQNFPFWSRSTIKRAFRSLIDRKLLLQANYNLAGYDRTGWYAINYPLLQDLVEQAQRAQPAPLGQNDLMDQPKLTPWIGSECPNGSGQNDPMDEVKMTSPIPETTMQHPHTNIIWAQALDELQLQMTKSAYETWIVRAQLSSLTLTGPDTYRATVMCTDHYVKDWLGTRLHTPLLRTLTGLLNVEEGQVTITYVTPEESTCNKSPPTS